MTFPLRLFLPLLLLPLPGVFAPAAIAQKFQPASNYICPNQSDTGLDCYLDAVSHLYTMCRHIKSIEIIEFGYEKSDEGVNGAKTAYCIEKHDQSMKRPLASAVREAGASRAAVDALRKLHDYWLLALAELKWVPGESDDMYKTRVAKPYVAFREWAVSVRAALPVGKGKPAPTAAATAKSPN